MEHHPKKHLDIGPDMLRHCELCPQKCGVDRTQAAGRCGCGSQAMAALAMLHPWEEPCISGTRGSGTIFFSGCTLRCCYCQNYKISHERFGKALSVRELADIFLRLQDQGAHNISLVTATQYLPTVLPALDLVRHRLLVPLVYNCGGYERTETVCALKDYIDIWLPDLKYHDPQLSLEFSGTADYFQAASAAVRQMVAQTGKPQFQGQLMHRGVIIRHLVLPGHRDDSIRLLQWVADTLPKGHYLISLMNQYTPYRRHSRHPELNRRLTSYEYQKVVDAMLSLGLEDGFLQEKSSARQEYTPPFNLEGL